MMKHESILAFVAVITVAGIADRAAAQNVAEGTAYFGQHCQMCHTNAPGDRNGAGPNLFGGRNPKAGSNPILGYSAALKNSKLSWTPKTLDQFLTMPVANAPRTRKLESH